MRHSPLFLILGVTLELISVTTTLTSSRALERLNDKETETAFERLVDRAVAAATNRLTQYETVLRAGAGVYIASNSVERHEWRAFIQNLDIEHSFPGSNGFGHVTRVLPGEIESFVERERADGWQDFKIKSIGPASPEPWVINVIEPSERNRAAVGLDISTEANRREAAEQAMLTGETKITQIISLVQDEQRKPGFLMFTPHYKTLTVPPTEDERRANCIGWTYAPFIGQEILKDLLTKHSAEVSFSIYDGVIAPDHQIADGGTPGNGGLRAQREVSVGGKQWLFVAHSTTPHPRSFLSTESRIVLLAGFATSSGLLVVLLLLFRASKRALTTADSATQQAVQAGEAKARFLAVISHEIRTPLNGVIGMTEVALSEPLADSLRTQIETIQVSGKTLLSLVNDILDFSRFSEGKVPLESLAFDASHEILNVTQLLKHSTRGKEIPLELHLPTTAWVRGDALRFRQILLNLTGNALKFSPKGKVTITLETTATGLHIKVQDTGIGMDSDTLSRLFTPFSQADASTSRRFGGTGLGLAIVKNLVSCMEGQITVQSAPGLGSCFEVALPLPHTPAPDTSATQSQSTEQLHLHVLVVDDNLTNRTVACSLLKKLGCTTSVAENGLEAIAKAPGHDVILMDCSMPEMDGFEATRHLRQNGSPVPIIALTANSFPEDKQRCLDSGMTGFLSKPIVKADLIAALGAALSTGKPLAPNS